MTGARPVAAGQESGETFSAAAARSELYRLFAQVFTHPTDELLDTFGDGSLFAALDEAAACLPYPSPFLDLEAEALPPGATAEDVRIFYSSTFEAGNPPVSMRETHYSKQGEKALFEELLRYYQHFGLKIDSGTLREWPDMLAVELEFMAYLASLQASLPAHAEALVRAQGDFLGRHLAAWVDAFAGRLAALPGAFVYPRLALFLARFIRDEQKFCHG